MKKIKSVEVLGKNGKPLKGKRFYDLVDNAIRIIPLPPKGSKVVINYYRTPKELKDSEAHIRQTK